MQEPISKMIPVNKSPSDLYLACAANDIEGVKTVCRNSSVSFASLNDIEPNGSTALHAAVESGHETIVRMLLIDFGVIRHRPNHDDFTAYQMVTSESIRKLFYRPTADRLLRYSQSVLGKDDFQLYENEYKDTNCRLLHAPVDRHEDYIHEEQTQNQSNNDDSNTRNQYISSYSTPVQIAMLHQVIGISRTLCRPSRIRTVSMSIAKALTWLKRESPPLLIHENNASLCNEFRLMIDRYVTIQHCQYNKACYLVDQYLHDDKIEHLLRLYTLPTPLSSRFQKESNSFNSTILRHLKHLQNRYFRGVAYRGMVIEANLIRAYKWAFEHYECLIITHDFMSTSIDRNISEISADNPLSNGRLSVLMVFNFSQASETAIRLYATSEVNLACACVSEFEAEQEVLVLPNTFFRITHIEQNHSFDDRYTMHLEYVPLTKRSYVQMMKLFAHEGYRNIRTQFQK
jgi:hypothetical protein